MKLWRTLRILLPVLAIVGIVIGPLTAPAASGMVPAATAEMADDMPCCPDEQPAMPDCSKACPLLAVCFAKCVQNLSTAAGTAIAPLILAGIIFPANDALGASLAQAPPARPPRT